jgi:phosphate:Na+ symporter
MDYGFLDVLTLIGSLGLFLFGMKIMSEALQRVAGSKMRQILSAMTSNRVKGVFTGFLITAVIQSSSATIVMIVSFVNAGLLSLIESIGVIMGANIGTTVTAWIISILGFKVKMSAFSLPLMGLSFPLLFSKNNKRKSWGEFVFGFAFVFMGLEFLKSSVPDLNNNPEMLSFLGDYADLGFLTSLIFLAIGTILTVVIQSSSATMALTLVMCNNGWIPFDAAAAMVLGENIGTTITANLAAIVGNVSAKRSARAHFIFNVIGVIWILIIFKLYLRIIGGVMVSSGLGSPFENPGSIPVALSLFHTSFNILNTIFLIGGAKLIARVVTLMVPQKEDEEEEFRLKYINFGLLSTSELSILQAKKEIILFGQRVSKMFSIVKSLNKEEKQKGFYKKSERIEKYENISDSIEVEIATYLTRIMENGDMGRISSERVRAMFHVIDDIESIADTNFNIMRTLTRKREGKVEFTDYQEANIKEMFSLVEDAFEVMNQNLELDYRSVNMVNAQKAENKINKFRNKLKREHLEQIEQKNYSYTSGTIYNDLYSELEKLGDYIINISESIYGILHKDEDQH